MSPRSIPSPMSASRAVSCATAPIRISSAVTPGIDAVSSPSQLAAGAMSIGVSVDGTAVSATVVAPSVEGAESPPPAQALARKITLHTTAKRRENFKVTIPPRSTGRPGRVLSTTKQLL